MIKQDQIHTIPQMQQEGEQLPSIMGSLHSAPIFMQSQLFSRPQSICKLGCSTTLTDIQSLNRFATTHSHCFVLFMAEWSTPCKQLHKRLRSLGLNTTVLGFIDIDAVDSFLLLQHFDISAVPHLILLKHGQPPQHTTTVLQQLQDLIKPFMKQPCTPQQLPMKKCNKNHSLSIVFQLDPSLYENNWFYCNQCKLLKKTQSPSQYVGHCTPCDYDLCTLCLQQ